MALRQPTGKKNWAYFVGNGVGELEDKPQEQADGEIPANLLLTFNGSSDKVKQNVCVCYKGAIVLLDKSVRRLELV